MNPQHAPTKKIIEDIWHCMEMYPALEVDFIVRAVNERDELLGLLREFVYGPATADKRKRGMRALSKAEAQQ